MFSIFDGADIGFSAILGNGIDIRRVVNLGDDVDFGHFGVGKDLEDISPVAQISFV